jgi:hypothetical protein
VLVDLECQAHDAKIGREVSIVITMRVVLDAGGEGGDHVCIKRFIEGIQEGCALCSIVGDHAFLGLKAII